MFCKRLLHTLLVCTAVCLHECVALSCDKVERCKCSMSDNSGEVNLKSIASDDGSAAFSVLDAVGWEYQFNPCNAFSSYYYTGLSIVQLNTGNIYDEYALGIQTTEKFSYSSSSGLSLQYADSLRFFNRNSSVLLICEYDSFEHRFEFIGELITLQYEFILTGPCACPGRCDDNGIVGSTVQPPTTTTTHATTTTLATALPPEIPSTTMATTPAGTTTTSAKPIEGMNWEIVGANLVALLLHDLIIVALIAIVIAVAKFFLGCTWNTLFSRSSDSHKQFSDA